MIRLANIPIFRRLFLAFFVAALILNSSILVMSFFYMRALQAHGMTPNEIRPFIFGTMVAMIIATAGVTGLGYLMNLTITQPLTSLAALARRIRAGQTDARATDLGHDEIAMVARSINHMLDAIEQLVRETQAQRDVLQEEAERLIAQVSPVGEGDLTIRAEVDSASIAVLADFFNYMVDELSELVARVRSVAMSMEHSTLTTQRDMFLLLNGADRQRSSIEQTALTVEGMAQASLEVVERAKQLNQAASRARQAAQEGRGTVQQILRGVAQISQKTQESAHLIYLLEGRSQEIGEVVTLLESLAHQTNKLALDAAIQVAMKSDATTTQGFGAIADEIRRISERAKAALTTVNQKVQGMRTDINTVSLAVAGAAHEAMTGTTQIQETGRSFETIFALVEQQAGESDTITTMMEQLYTSSFGIVKTMQMVSQHTQESNERTRQVAHNMQQLATLSQQLHISVEVFKLKSTDPVISQRESREALGTW
jgi:methyl-accepting chemotaxis protein